jgi:hypothetical protein
MNSFLARSDAPVKIEYLTCVVAPVEASGVEQAGAPELVAPGRIGGQSV